MHDHQNFEISQQSRDAVAVLHAVGETSAFVFGNSSGAVIALDMAKTQPQVVRAVVVHETPVPRMLPHARKWQRFFAGVYATAYRFGSYVAALRFMLGVELPVRKLATAQARANKYTKSRRAQSGERRLSNKTAVEVLVKLELLPVTNYLPDVELIKKKEISIRIASSLVSSLIPGFTI